MHTVILHILFLVSFLIFTTLHSIAKYFESTVSSRGEALNHYTQMGVTASKMCYEPIMRYGKEAMESNNEGKVSYAYEQVVLAIIVSTGIASIFLTAEHIIDYNTVFYILTWLPVF